MTALSMYRPVNSRSKDRELHNGYFTIEESARTWFENHEASFTSWNVFCTKLFATFTNANRREVAEADLHALKPQQNESVRIYVEY